jgi:hypothetical protein
MHFRQNFAVVTAGSPLYVQQIVKRSSTVETQVYCLFLQENLTEGGEVSPAFQRDKTTCHAGLPATTAGNASPLFQPVLGSLKISA